MSEHIRRDDAKAKGALLQQLLDEAKKSHLLAGAETIDENFHLGRYGGLLWAYNAVAHGWDVDALPAAGEAVAEGRWEKLREELLLSVAMWKEDNIISQTHRQANLNVLSLMDRLSAPEPPRCGITRLSVAEPERN